MGTHNNEEWFASWFDSPYYHMLYCNRDENEAESFLTLLTAHLQLPDSAHLLDLACGSGRHSRVLGRLGFQVSGCDLSPNSIAEAQRLASEGMYFFIHDMRDALPGTYDVIFNLFTSFGYFDHPSDNGKVLRSAADALEEGGLLIIDFMNTEKIIRELKPRQEILRGEQLFHIKREVVNAKIVKTIAFEAEGKSWFFQEKVQALTLTDFQQLISEAGFKLEETFGSYSLEPYNAISSDRLIMICKKA